MAFNACPKYVFVLCRFDHDSQYFKDILGCMFDTYLKYRLVYSFIQFQPN